MLKNTIYLAVGNPKAMQSSVWRIWTEKDDIYILARGESGKFYKLSLHQSGVSRLAYISDKDVKDPLTIGNDPRLIWRWQPKDSIDGWNRRLDIIVYILPIKNYFTLDSIGSPKDNIVWLDTLPLGYKHQITLLVADSVSQFPNEITIPGDKVIGSILLTSGKVLWIRAREEKISTSEEIQLKKYHDLKINFDSEQDAVFAQITEVDKDSLHPVITNFTLGWDHVFINNSNQ